MCNMDEEYVHIPDAVSYNHYFGWYGGDTSMNGPWFDKFHAKYPNKPIGVSEYGCEALNWHTSDPKQGDYTEEYQAYYHEELIKQLYTRPLWFWPFSPPSLRASAPKSNMFHTWVAHRYLRLNSWRISSS